MKISIPLINNKISDHFGGADSFFIAEIGDNGEIVREFTQTPPEHAPGVYPKWLKSENVDILLTKSIGGRAIAFLKDYGIKVITGINNGEPSKIVSEYIKGNISSSNEFCAGSGNCSEH